MDICASPYSADAALPDDAIFVLNEHYKRDDPTCVYLSEVAEFALFYRVLHGMYEALGAALQDPNAIRDHEAQHSIAAGRIDTTHQPADDVCGVRMTRKGLEAFETAPFIVHQGLVTPKLGLAALLAYPESDGGPSPNDVARIRTLGYEDVADVAEHVELWNASAGGDGLILPLPLTAGVPVRL